MSRDSAHPGSAPSPGPARPQDAAGSVERALVAGMARADAMAMEIFYDRYASELYGLLRSMVQEPEAAEELLQETMWQVWRQAGRYDPGRASVRTWLHLIMRSRVLDWRRRELRRPAADLLVEAAEVADPATSAEMARAGERQDLLRAEAGLSAAERQAIRLTYYRGLTQAEAARALGVPLGTLKSRVRSALMRLQADIGSGGPAEGGQT
jgi:RNA polymerase sigma-70 factor, ECF subfamily